MFSPSQLAFGEECLLRALLGSTRELPALTAHPAAALGNVFHRLLEMAVRGEIPRAGMPSDDAQRALDHLLDEADQKLAAAWPINPPRVRDVFPPLTWRRKRRVVLDLAEKYLSGQLPTPAGSTGRPALNAKSLPRNGSWAEVEIEAPALRLRGRADLIQRTEGDVVIRDLKTGRVLTNDGEVLPHIERQMRLYGTMARSLWPSARLSLIVDDGVEREVRFLAQDENEIMTWLRGVLGQIPPNRDIDTESLATLGPACEGCLYRHICPAYRNNAPKCWRGEGPIRMPLDTWGEVVSVAVRLDGLADVTIEDAAERVVRVFGLAAFRLAAMRPGDRIWLFGLRTQERRGGPEVWRQPRNFFEIADDDRFARAWTLQMFVL